MLQAKQETRKQPTIQELEKKLSANLNYNSDVPLKKVDITAEVIENFAIISLVQVYKNYDPENPKNDKLAAVDVEYVFPVLAQSCIISFQAEIGGNIYLGTVDLKEKVHQREQELHDKGISTVKAEYLHDWLDVVKLSIGNLQPNQEIKITFKFSLKVDSFNSTDGRLIIPMVILNRTKPIQKEPKLEDCKEEENEQIGEFKAEIEYGTPSYEFSLRLIINREENHNPDIASMSGFQKEDFDLQTEAKRVTYTLKTSPIRLPNRDFIIRYKANSGKIPKQQPLHKICHSPADLKEGKPPKIDSCAFSSFVIPPNSKRPLPRSG